MKKGIHPTYQPTAFLDTTIDKTFIIGSTLQSTETTTIEGVTYPLIQLSTSQYSHPFYTGKQSNIKARGRVETFYKKYKK